MTPRKTPHRLPATRAGGTPASSSASQLSSSARRCCGSMCSASVRGILKKEASNRSTPSMNPAAVGRPIAERRVTCPQRSSGTSRSGSTPSRGLRQNSSGVAAPGIRQESPTIAIGSSAAVSRRAVSSDARVDATAARCRASARTVENSHSTVMGSSRPSAALRRASKAMLRAEIQPLQLERLLDVDRLRLDPEQGGELADQQARNRRRGPRRVVRVLLQVIAPGRPSVGLTPKGGA